MRSSGQSHQAILSKFLNLFGSETHLDDLRRHASNDRIRRNVLDNNGAGGNNGAMPTVTFATIRAREPIQTSFPIVMNSGGPVHRQACRL